MGIAHGTLYLQGKQAKKDKQVAVSIEAWHEKDDTLGHRKLAALLNMGKNRVKRVMKKYGIGCSKITFLLLSGRPKKEDLIVVCTIGGKKKG
ncbi:MAG TPA: hypothetical protein VGN34_08010 [Ktedonobacteraceae bacterium]